LWRLFPKFFIFDFAGMRKSFITILFLCHLIGLTQNKFIDSLQQELRKTANDTNKVKLLGDISWEFMNNGNYDSALFYSNGELKLASSPLLNGWEWPKGVALANNGLGVIYFNKGFYPIALQHYFTALRIQEKLGDKKGIASIYNGIGNIYGIQNQYDLALKNHTAALEMRKQMHNKRGMANSYGNIGNVYYNKGNYAEALRNYRECLGLMKETGNAQGIANAYGNLGLVYLAQKHYADALENQFASLKIHREIGDLQGEGITYINLAIIHTKLRNYKEAEQYAAKAVKISEELGDLESMKDAFHALSEICEMTSRPKEAFYHYRSFIVARDSLLNEENTKESMRLEMNYEFDKKEAATKLEQEKKEVVAAAEKRRQRIILLAISGFGILVLAFAVFAYRSFLQKQKANLAITRQKELIEEKQKAILDSIHYARRIQTALFTSEKYIARTLNKLKRE